MKAIVSREENKKTKSQIEEFSPAKLKEGEVRIRTAYSSINYKDALGVTGKGKIFKTFPIVAGIDAAGTVSESRSNNFKSGDPVIITGCGFGETHNGGYSQEIVEEAQNIVKCPRGLTPREAMIYGTAGFTAALAVERMERNGQEKSMGPILVTGASGGVGQFAVSFFAKLGYEVHALTGKPSSKPRLLELGATQVILDSDFELGRRPLEPTKYGGVIDNLGGRWLNGIIPLVGLWGNVACIGLASGPELNATVMPLILRGVSLLGISSNNTTWPLRLKIWDRLATDLKPKDLNSFVSQEVNLDDVLSVSELMLERKTSGRYLVKL